MKLQLLFCFILISAFLFSQEPKEIENGIITMVNDEQIEFVNLRYEGEKVYFTNVKNQKVEHLYINSIKRIDNVGTELKQTETSKEAVRKIESTNSNNLKNGFYKTFEDLIENKPETTTYNLKQRNQYKENYFFLLDENNKKIKTGFAFVENGILYVRAKDTKNYFKEKKSRHFSNRKIFVKMEKNNGNYIANIPFSNNTIALTGAIISGVAAGILAPAIGSSIVFASAGAGLSSIVAVNKETLVVDLNNKMIYLE